MPLTLPAVDYGDPRLPERFWAKVHPCPITGCWRWCASSNGRGYGQYFLGKINGRKRLTTAHRAMWIAMVGDPGPLVVDHQCHNWDLSCRLTVTCPHRACVRLDHLRAVTQAVNLTDGHTPQGDRLRTGTCGRGHDLSIPGALLPDGHCRLCARDSKRLRTERRTGVRFIPLGDRTHCNGGHLRIPENIRTESGSGSTHCILCKKKQSRASYLRSLKRQSLGQAAELSSPIPA